MKELHCEIVLVYPGASLKVSGHVGKILLQNGETKKYIIDFGCNNLSQYDANDLFKLKSSNEIASFIQREKTNLSVREHRELCMIYNKIDLLNVHTIYEVLEMLANECSSQKIFDGVTITISEHEKLLLEQEKENKKSNSR